VKSQLALASSENIDVYSYHTCEESYKHLHLLPDIILLDYHMNSRVYDAMNAKDALKHLRTQCPHAIIVLISSEHNMELINEAILHGASKYIRKDQEVYSEVVKIVKKLITHQKTVRIKRRLLRALLVSVFLIILVYGLLYLWMEQNQ
jgi:DNA-binding NarL/FixJ family response regulator